MPGISRRISCASRVTGRSSAIVVLLSCVLIAEEVVSMMGPEDATSTERHADASHKRRRGANFRLETLRCGLVFPKGPNLCHHTAKQLPNSPHD